MNNVFISIISFGIYYLLVQLGALFTIPFGFASPIWPVSGVMLGLYFLYGRPVLIGALLASLLTLQQDTLSQTLSSATLCILAIISILQLIIAQQLISRYCTLPVKTHNLLQIIKFLLLTGPLTVFISSLLFMLTLGFSLDIAPQTLNYIWSIKWLGDLLSIVFITPIFLFLKENIYVRKAKRSSIAILASVFSFCLISFIFLFSNNNNIDEKEQEFIRSVQPFIKQMNVVQATIENNLTALDGLFQASNKVTKEEFKIFANTIYDEQLNFRAIGWLPLITHSQRMNFENKLSSQGLIKPYIKEVTKEGLQLAKKQKHYFPIYFIEPFERNKSAIGLDVNTHPIVSKTVHQAIKNKRHVISPLLSLAQQQDKNTAVIVYYPAYKVEEGHGNQTLQGIVEVIFELDVLLPSLQKNTEVDNFTYQLRYGINNVFSHQNFNENSFFNYNIEIAFFDKKASLSFASTSEFEKILIDWQSIILTLISSIIGVVCVMFIFFIITFNYFLTKKVNAGTTELLEKNKELTTANQTKNLFLANISHEYRTPLNAIMGFTEIALREVKEKNALDYFTKIQHSSNILLSIVNDVLDTSKIQAGEINLEVRPFCPSIVTQTVIDMLIEKANDKSVTIHNNFTSNFDGWVMGDETRFKQIIINLLNNAIKFTHQGSISINGDSHYDDNQNSILTIVIKDTGIGINEDGQKKLFEPFSQATNSTTRKYGGTGLGLSIVKQLCALMGGNVTLTSQLDIGSTFTVTITLPKTDKPIKKVLTEPSESQRTNYKNTKILVVEDNKINQLIVKKQLAYKGIASDLADDGLQALSYLKENIPDLILMDLQMPNMDGFTASSLIKQNDKLKHIPIIILSASVGKEEKGKASELGIYDFINKPFQLDDLLLILEKYLPPSSEK